MDWKDFLAENPGLDPFQSEFLAKDELVTIVPKISTAARLTLYSIPSIAPLHQGSEVTVPLWVALELKRKNLCSLIPPAWLNELTLTQIWTHEKSNPDSLLPISFFWQEIAKLYLLHSGEDLGTTQARNDLVSTLRHIEDVRANKIMLMTRSIDFLSESDVPVFLIPNITSGEIVRFRSYLLCQINELMQIYKAYNGVLNARLAEDQTRHDKFYVLLKKQEEEQQRKKKTSELLARSALIQPSLNTFPTNLSTNPSNQSTNHVTPSPPAFQRTDNININDDPNNDDDLPSSPSIPPRSTLPPFNTNDNNESQRSYQSPTRKPQQSQPSSPFKRAQALSQSLNSQSGFFKPPQSPVSGRVAQAALQYLSPNSQHSTRQTPLQSPRQTPQHGRTFESSEKNLQSMIQSLNSQEDRLNNLPPGTFSSDLLTDPTNSSQQLHTQSNLPKPQPPLNHYQPPRQARFSHQTNMSQRLSTSASPGSHTGSHTPNTLSSASNTPITPTSSQSTTRRLLPISLQAQLDNSQHGTDPPPSQHTYNLPNATHFSPRCYTRIDILEHDANEVSKQSRYESKELMDVSKDLALSQSSTPVGSLTPNSHTSDEFDMPLDDSANENIDVKPLASTTPSTFENQFNFSRFNGDSQSQTPNLPTDAALRLSHSPGQQRPTGTAVGGVRRTAVQRDTLDYSEAHANQIRNDAQHSQNSSDQGDNDEVEQR